jgi:hypothetical protein
MRTTPLLAVICSVFCLGTAQTTQANELDFNLAQSGPAIAVVEPQGLAQPSGRPAVIATAEGQDLAPPVIGQSVSGGERLVHPIEGGERPTANLPHPTLPPEAPPTAINELVTATPLVPTELPKPVGASHQLAPAAIAAMAAVAPLPADRGVVLDFDLQTSAKIATPSQPAASSSDAQPDQVTPQKSAARPVALAAQPLSANADPLFAGGADSIVARTVGHAEGTRTAAGEKTDAYYGHVDPGNAHWNLGSFSYQHCDQTCTPEIADDRQLARLKRQAEVLQQRAEANQLTLTLEEALNGIDLANQAPLAALDTGGYIDWLKAARQKGLTGSDAVLWARTWSFLNPRTQTWDAPGLGNQYESISHDQDRRLSAIARALSNYHAQRH